MLDILSSVLRREGHNFDRIDGKLDSQKRYDKVRKFNTDSTISILLISTKAGGTGLNLASANVVINFDLSWNPSHDLQAQDRCYRIGQKKDVLVYRLISVGTVEEAMYKRQIDKQQLAGSYYSEASQKRYFKQEELIGALNIFEYSPENKCETEKIIERYKSRLKDSQNSENGVVYFHSNAQIVKHEKQKIIETTTDEEKQQPKKQNSKQNWIEKLKQKLENREKLREIEKHKCLKKTKIFLEDKKEFKKRALRLKHKKCNFQPKRIDYL
ncbi:DNA excision repair protein ERCC-6-like 2 [Bonamia ostreae]|uniref:DNA excision repair protein ERCC-6-like 2 n=1 Tax=Bonamia ostreae TaxID=126728 RepID=A0ABV2AHG1_9EUKA